MKTFTLALVATVAALAATSARADTRVNIGINLGLPVYRPAPPVVVVAPPAYTHSRAPVVVVPARGYWKEIVVKTWVPERHVVRHNRWGRPERICEPGYYAYRTERVWVDGREGGRGYSHSYGHDRNHDHRGDWRR